MASFLSKRRKGSGSSRANYAPGPSDTGFRRRLPVGWVNMGGFVLFLIVTLALLADLARSLGGGRGNDPFAILLVLVLSAAMVWLFATTRVED